MAYVQRKIPFVGTPDTNPETKPFFDGCAAGKLVLPPLQGYRKVHLVSARDLARSPSVRCEWVEVSGKGTIYTFSVMERADPPYAIAYVDVGGGAAHDDQHRGLRFFQP